MCAKFFLVFTHPFLNHENYSQQWLQLNVQLKGMSSDYEFFFSPFLCCFPTRVNVGLESWKCVACVATLYISPFMSNNKLFAEGSVHRRN